MLLAFTLLASVAPSGSAAAYPDRFVWVFGWNLGRDSHVEEIARVLKTASESGLNGAVLSVGLDTLCKKPAEYFDRLAEVNRACDRYHLELIPSLFSVGYGGATLAHDRNLAEGLPVEDALFVVQDREARLVADPEVHIENGGFEEFEGNRFKGFRFHDQPGEVSFADTTVKHDGRASLRLENFRANPHGHGRVMQEIRVQPHRCYRLSVWVKTEGLRPASAFRMLALAGERDIAPRSFELPSTTEWRRLTMLVNSLGFDSIRAYAGLWGGQEGKVWLDDWRIEEVGPLNVLQRAGTPVAVRNDDRSVVYEAGKDFETLRDSQFNFYRVDREAPPLRLLPGSRIQEGQHLRVSWFHPMVVNESQVTVCMAEPAVYEIWEHEVKLLSEHLQPRRFLLNMDEVRMGGTCMACRGKPMGELLGQCITRQVGILRRHFPGAEVYVWSDMLDPNHNAHGDYYLVEGSFAGSWEQVPKDLIIAVWGGAPRPKSLRFFSDQGFRTLVACYYDANDLAGVEGWLEIARDRPNVRGFMYTPWQRKYDLLPGFGVLLKGRR